MGLFYNVLSSRTVTTVVKNAATGIGAIWKRNFQTSSHLYAHPLPHAGTPEEGRQSIRSLVGAARRTGFLVPKPKNLGILTLPEFGFNGFRDGRGVFRADASRPITLETFEGIVSEAVLQAKGLPPGFLIVIGTAAITGKRLNGEVFNVNAGAAIVSGPQAKARIYSKRNESDIDGWRRGQVVDKGHGPITLTVNDVLGTGKDRKLTVAVCLDFKEMIVKRPLPAGQDPDAFIVVAAGAPLGIPGAPHQDLEIFVNDGLDPQGRTGIWKRGNDPTLPFQGGVNRLTDPASARGGSPFALETPPRPFRPYPEDKAGPGSGTGSATAKTASPFKPSDAALPANAGGDMAATSLARTSPFDNPPEFAPGASNGSFPSPTDPGFGANSSAQRATNAFKAADESGEELAALM